MTNPYLADRLPEPLPADPMHWANAWLREASAQDNRRNPNSVTLVTVGQDAKPSARVVLCKSFQSDAGYIVVYTNYLSRKCQEIEGNANVSLLFHWDCMGRQIRIGGTAVRSPAAEVTPILHRAIPAASWARGAATRVNQSLPERHWCNKYGSVRRSMEYP